jgi:pimeloyl-ACP methyl ester carboxylesterase
MALMPKKLLGKYMLKKLYINKELITEDKIKRYASYFMKYDNIKGIIQTAKNIVPKNTDEIILKIKDIDIPALIIWGEKDFVIKKRNILKLNKDLIDSKLIIAENAGHVVQEEKPELVAAETRLFVNDDISIS